MRYFVTFKETSTLANKLMVFTGLTRNQVQDNMIKSYGESWFKIYTEQEAAQLLPALYCKKDHWVSYGHECKYRPKTCDGLGSEKVYPCKYEPEHSVSLKSISDWFKTAKPSPKHTDLEEIKQTITTLISSPNFTDDTTLHLKLIFNLVGLSYLSKFNLDEELTKFNQQKWRNLNETT